MKPLVNLIFGDPADVDKPLMWYNYIFLGIKVLTPLCCIVFLFLKMYALGCLFLVCFIVDIMMTRQLKKRYENYKSVEKVKLELKLNGDR